MKISVKAIADHPGKYPLDGVSSPETQVRSFFFVRSFYWRGSRGAGP
jgi:hypothetical protein